MTEPRRRILVVDDDLDIRDAFKDFLEEMGYEVACVPDGHTALADLRRHGAALVLLDVMMPGMDGREFRKRQLSDPTLREIPVIIVTADQRISDPRIRIKDDSGAWDLFGDLPCMAKPFDGEALLSVVRRYC
jgi:CheY-like chemotaxis protein